MLKTKKYSVKKEKINDKINKRNGEIHEEL